ncbi:MAG: 4Fe-4S binding protein [Bacillota bacterium]
MYLVTVKKDKCNGCGECVSVCPVELLFLEDGKAEANGDIECMGCESCVAACPNDAIRVQEL